MPLTSLLIVVIVLDFTVRTVKIHCMIDVFDIVEIAIDYHLIFPKLKNCLVTVEEASKSKFW